jgi:hypothetical protein
VEKWQGLVGPSAPSGWFAGKIGWRSMLCHYKETAWLNILAQHYVVPRWGAAVLRPYKNAG